MKTLLLIALAAVPMMAQYDHPVRYFPFDPPAGCSTQAPMWNNWAGHLWRCKAGAYQQVDGAQLPATTSALKGDGAGNATPVTGSAGNCVHVDGSSGACGGGTVNAPAIKDGTSFTTTGTGTAYTGCPATPGALAAYQVYLVTFNAVSTSTTPTLDICSSGGKTLVHADGVHSALASGEVSTTSYCGAFYDGTNIQISGQCLTGPATITLQGNTSAPTPASGFGNITFDTTAKVPKGKAADGSVSAMVIPNTCSGQVVQSISADGVITCAAAGSGSPAGSNKELQYNNAGGFGAVGSSDVSGTNFNVPRNAKFGPNLKAYVGENGVSGQALITVTDNFGNLFNLIPATNGIDAATLWMGPATTNTGVAIWLRGGVQLAPSGSIYTCNATTRGMLWVTNSGAGVKDLLQVCEKDAADAYAWVTLNASTGTPSGSSGDLQTNNGSGALGTANLNQNADGSVNASKALNQAAPTTTSYTSGGTTTIDWSQGNVTKITMATGNTTLGAPSNPHGAGPYTIIWIQDTSCRTVTYNAVFKGAAAPDCGSGAKTVQDFTWDGTNYQAKTPYVPGSAWHGSNPAPAVIFSNFPGCSAAYEGASGPILDGSTAVIGATVTGGGSNHVSMQCNATNWVVMTGTTPAQRGVDINSSDQVTATHLASPETVAQGGTGLGSGTSGGVLCFTGSTTIASSAAQALNAMMIGGGAGACPTSLAVTFSTQTDGATITWALASAVVANATVTLGGNRTLNITNPLNGGSYVFRIVQDGTGTRTLALGTGCTWKISGGGAGAITPSTAAGSIDVLAFTYDGTNCYGNFAKNFN